MGPLQRRAMLAALTYAHTMRLMIPFDEIASMPISSLPTEMRDPISGRPVPRTVAGRGAIVHPSHSNEVMAGA